jgi:hypothetical protein
MAASPPSRQSAHKSGSKLGDWPDASDYEGSLRQAGLCLSHLSDEDVYRCPAGEKLNYHYTNEEHGQKLRRYWTNACRDCVLKPRCTTGKERRITRWEQ